MEIDIIPASRIKETVARDFPPLLFQTASSEILYDNLKFCRILEEILCYEIVSAVNPGTQLKGAKSGKV